MAVALFNEGAGNQGLALILLDAGSMDNLVLFTVGGDPAKSGKLTKLMSVSMSGQILEKTWYRVAITVEPGTPKVTGQVFKHSTATDPNSGLGGQVGATLTYTPGALPAGVTSPGENGIIADAVSATVNSSVTNFTNDPVACGVTGPPPPPPSTAFPASGQTTSYTAGDDGDVKAGAPLSYTDNGDGTITDNNTGLMWEKKSDDGTIHDKDTTYTWANAFAVHIAGLNAGGGFAGHTDWRLPNVKELQSIVNYQNFPSVSSAFNTSCSATCTVLTCSCTAVSNYWSSSTFAVGPPFAWVVDFFSLGVFALDKSNNFVVRAVRGGL